MNDAACGHCGGGAHLMAPAIISWLGLGVCTIVGRWLAGAHLVKYLHTDFGGQAMQDLNLNIQGGYTMNMDSAIQKSFFPWMFKFKSLRQRNFDFFFKNLPNFWLKSEDLFKIEGSLYSQLQIV